MEATRKKSTTFNIVMVGLCAALMCISGPFAIPIPFSPVPISLIPLAIFICAFLLDWKLCGLSYVIFLLLGMVGLPVFSGFSGGLAKLAGPTGGYLIGFILTALVTGFFINKFNKIYMYVIGMILGMVFGYLFGTIWFVYQQGTTFAAALSLCVFPYLPGEAVKMVIAALVGPILKNRMAKLSI